MIIHEGDDLAERMSGGACFQCGEPIYAPFVHWHGSDAGGEVTNADFHPECALSFGLRFMRDVYELDLNRELPYGQRGT